MSNEMVKKEQTELQKQELTASERFTGMVMKEFQGNIGTLNLKGKIFIGDFSQESGPDGVFPANKLSECLKKLGIDLVRFKTGTPARVNKNSWKSTKEEDKNNLPITWQNVNMNDLAIAVVHHAKLGLDMQIPNHLNAIPYKNNKTQKYDIGFLKGYKGLEYIATQLSLYPIRNIVVELIYSNDVFEIVKINEIVNKDNITRYNFIIKNPFDRGEIIGGFGYIQYVDETRNKIVTLSKKDIDKRKPAYAAAEFWGGEKDKWENGKKVGKEKIEGWYEEMARKTIARATYNAVPIDPKKVNESYAYVIENNESTYENVIEVQVDEEIKENANKELIDIETGEIVNIEENASADNNIDMTPKQNEGPAF